MHAYAPCWAGASGGARPEEANEAGEGHGRSNPGRKKQGEGGGNQPDTGCVPATTPSGLAGTQARSHARHARHAPRTHPHCRSLEAAVAQDAATPRPRARRGGHWKRRPPLPRQRTRPRPASPQAPPPPRSSTAMPIWRTRIQPADPSPPNWSPRTAAAAAAPGEAGPGLVLLAGDGAGLFSFRQASGEK